MNEKPEALRLAEWIESDPIPGDNKIASTLRRQHAEIEQLRELLLDIRKDAAASHWHRDIDAALQQEV